MSTGNPNPGQPPNPGKPDETPHAFEHDAPRPPRPAPGPKSRQVRQIVALGIVVVVLLLIIYAAAGGEFRNAEWVSRFNFFGVPNVRQKHQSMVDLRTLLKPTPQMLAAGKQVFSINCVPCHGADGLGNGPRSAGLSPAPRDFHDPTSKFTNGTSIITLYHTVSDGVSGTSMPAWAGVLTPTQRMDAAHYVQHWIPNPQVDTPAQIAGLPQPSAAAAPVGPTPLPKLKAVSSGPRIPIDLAMKLKAQPVPSDPPMAPVADNAEGAAIYHADCAGCHRAGGQGGKPLWMLSFQPYVEETAQAFNRPLMPAWAHSEPAFAALVAHGLPGRMMPGYGALTQAQMSALYTHVEHLAGELSAHPPAPAAPAPDVKKRG
ncbi:MAG: c-type cytochrome [Terriglobales bacterium]